MQQSKTGGKLPLSLRLSFLVCTMVRYKLNLCSCCDAFTNKYKGLRVKDHSYELSPYQNYSGKPTMAFNPYDSTLEAFDRNLYPPLLNAQTKLMTFYVFPVKNIAYCNGHFYCVALLPQKVLHEQQGSVVSFQSQKAK